jgi:hypothetical protein
VTRIPVSPLGRITRKPRLRPLDEIRHVPQPTNSITRAALRSRAFDNYFALSYHRPDQLRPLGISTSRVSLEPKMGINRTLKYKRYKRQSPIELVDKLIGKSLDALNSGRMRVSVSDWIRFIHMRRKLFPEALVPKPPTWVDGR